MEEQRATKQKDKEVFRGKKATLKKQKLHPNEECRKACTPWQFKSEIMVSQNQKKKCLKRCLHKQKTKTNYSFFSVTGMESLSSVCEVHAKGAKKLKP